ncbi:MAG: rod-binding protein [Desulfovibrionaceae bacterium]
MNDGGFDTQAAMSQADRAELNQFKLRMDGLKKRLTGGPSEEEQLRKACRDFEAVFIGKLWQEMRKNVPKEGYLHSKQEEMYVSMFDREFSEHMADAGGIGLADMLYEQLARQLKQTSDATVPGGVSIKPLAESGKAEIKTLEESLNTVRPLRDAPGEEPPAPQEIIPEGVGLAPEEEQPEEGRPEEASAIEERSASEQGTPAFGETDDAAAAAAENSTSPAPPRDVSSLTEGQVAGELDALARNLRERFAARTDPGAVFDRARKGAFLGGAEDHESVGRILAKI